jgi:hypothetical protein
MSVLIKPMQKKAQVLAQSASHRLGLRWTPSSNEKKAQNQPDGIVSHRTEVCRGEQRGRVKRCHCFKMPAMEEYPNIPTIPSGRSDLLESAPPNLMPAPDVSDSSASALEAIAE